MADCYLPEADDLHRRWLPREIFADIGIVDADVEAVATSKAVAAAAAVEDLAAHLTGLLGAGGKGKVAAPLAPPQPTPPPPPPPLPPVAAPFHGAQACGLEGAVVLAYGGGNAVVGAGAAVAWPFVPYPPVQWQFPSNMVMNGAAVVLDPWFAQPPCLVPPPVMAPVPAPRLGGTGVFLPRAQPHRPQHWAKHPGQDDKSTRAGPGKNQQKEKQENQQKEKQQPGQGQNAEAAAAAVHAGPEVAALPQEWCYNN